MPGSPAQGSSVRKISPHNFWLQKPLRVVSGRNFWSPTQFLLTHTQTHLLRPTPSELQHWGSSLKGTSGTHGETGSVWHQGTHNCPFSKPSPHRAGKRVPYLRLHQPGSHCLPHPGDPLRLRPTKLTGPSKLLTFTFLYESLVLAHASQLPNSSQTSNHQSQ